MINSDANAANSEIISTNEDIIPGKFSDIKLLTDDRNDDIFVCMPSKNSATLVPDFSKAKNAPASPAMAAVTARTGRPPMAAATFGSILRTVPIPLVSLPVTISAGPSAATKTATFAIIVFVLSSRLLNLSTRLCIFETISLTVGIRMSENEIASSWRAD